MSGRGGREATGGAGGKTHPSSGGSGASGSSGSGGSSGVSSHQASTSKMGGEQKFPSSSREQRNMAEKMRRDKLNNHINELAGIVPMGSGATKRIDKTSVLRLAANYLRLQKFLREDDNSANTSSCSMGQGVGQVLGGGIVQTLAEAVGGFLLVVTSTGKVVYITEAVDQFFGHSQVDLLGHSVYNVIHPDDHEIFQQQLLPRDNPRRSFFCRMMEKALSRNDPGRYEIIHIVGQLRPIPSSATSGIAIPAVSGAANSSSADHESDEYNTDDEEDSFSLRGAAARQRMGTHMLVSFVRVVKDRPITEISRVESTQDEYITRHGLDSKILYTDHRISFVTGMMPGEVVGTSAFSYMHPDDMVWSIMAQRLMLMSAQGQGMVSYRLQCRDGTHVSLRSRGYLEVNKQTGEVESFVCINTLLDVKEADDEIKNQRRKLLPIVSCQETDDYLINISSSLPPELLKALKQMMNPDTMQKLAEAGPAIMSGREQPMGISFSSHSDMNNHGVCGVKNSQEGSLNHDEEMNDFNPFQSRPKRLCGFERSPKSMVQQDLQSDREKAIDKNTWYNVSSNLNSSDDFTGVVTKKFSFDRESYQSSSGQQCSSVTSPQMCSPTMTSHKSTEIYTPSTAEHLSATSYTNQKLAQDIGTGCYQQSSGSLASPSPSYDSGIVSPSGNHEFSQNREKSPIPLTPYSPSIDLLSPETPNYRKLSPSYPSPQSHNPGMRGNMNSGCYEQGGSPHFKDSGFKTSANFQTFSGSSNGIPSPGTHHHSTVSPNSFDENKGNLAAYPNSEQWCEGAGMYVSTSSPQNCSNNVLPHNHSFQPTSSSHVTLPKENISLCPQGQFSAKSCIVGDMQPQYSHQTQRDSMITNIHPSQEHDINYSAIQIFDMSLSSHQPLKQVTHPQEHQSKVEHTSSCISSGQCLSVDARTGVGAAQCQGTGEQSLHLGLQEGRIRIPAKDGGNRGDGAGVREFYEREYPLHSQHHGKLL